MIAEVTKDTELIIRKTQIMSTPQLRLSTKLAYGSGSLANTIPLALQNLFWLFFLTNVAGLNPSLAGTVLLIGKNLGWDQ